MMRWREHVVTSKRVTSGHGVMMRALARVLVGAQLFGLTTIGGGAASGPGVSASIGGDVPATALAVVEADTVVVPASNVTANRRRPAVTPAAPFRGFSAQPTDEEFFRGGGFEEPLVPVGARTTPAENRALAHALQQYRIGGAEATAPLQEFLAAHPRTAWRASLLTNLGLRLRDVGAYGRALPLWLEAWEAARPDTTAHGRAVADLAIAEWLTLTTRLGRVKETTPYFDVLRTRDVGGASAVKITRAREQLTWLRVGSPGGTPQETRGIARIARFLRGDGSAHGLPAAADGAGASRTSLRAQLAADETGLALRPVRRAGGGAFAAPSIVYLKTGHALVLLARQGDRFDAYDPLFERHLSLHASTLEAEASGEGLLPAAAVATPESGWREVPVESLEGGTFPISCPPGTAGDDAPPDCSPCTTSSSPGMPTYSLLPLNAGLVLRDQPVGYRPPLGPSMSLGVTYSARSLTQPSIFTFGNLGPNWRFDWLAYVEERPVTCTVVACIDGEIRVTLRGGGHEAHDLPPANVSSPHWRSHAVVVRTSTAPASYERRLPDGTKEIYGLPETTSPDARVFLTEVIDPQGHGVQLTYDAQRRLVALTDALGQVSTIAYEHATDPLKMTKITDPFGRSASFTYNAAGQLASITDVIALTSSFLYGSSDFIVELTTPYGTTKFRWEETPTASVSRFVEVTDPEGGHERIEYWIDHPTLAATAPASEVPDGLTAANSQLNKYVTLFWDRNAMARQPLDVASARVTKWLLRQGPDYLGLVTSGVPHSVKRQLERRTWYLYAGQSPAVGSITVGHGTMPIRTARVMDDGTTQNAFATYNALGQITSRTDPLARRTSYTYAPNDIDLIEVRQTTGAMNDLLAQYSGYNAQHLPTTIVDAAGQSTTLTYNTAGQVLTATNAKSETTTNVYDANGYLQSVTGPVSGATTAYTYDSYGRIRTTTDADGYVVTTDYDLFDRPVKTTYPDATFEQTVYDKLDPVRRRDRLGRWSYTFYDALRRVVATRDPLGRTIQQQWCMCGSLDALIDGKGQKTRWERDLQGRVTREVRADNVTATVYTYEASSGRLKTVTDPKLQVTTYIYNLDDSLQQVAYTNAQIATPSVSYTYETAYNRLATMVDGIGTTTYGYKAAGTLGAGQVASVDGPLTDDTITYTYDQLGRVTVRAINGVANQTTQTYDALGRVTTEVNPLGSFTYGYDGVTPRLASVAYPNGQTSAYAYYNNAGDHRLQTIHHKRPGGATLSKFDYTYDAVGNIATWQQQADSNPPVDWRYTYDGADQLLTAYKWSTGTAPTLLNRLAYTYDLAANRTTVQVNDVVTLTTSDSLNRLSARQPGGALRVVGQVDEPAVVAIQGQQVPVTSSGSFVGNASVSGTSATFTIQATDVAGNARTQQYEFDSVGASTVFSYDANGNLQSDGDRSFEWDATNSLVAITADGRRTEFVYDGQRRRVRAATTENDVVTASHDIVWCDTELCAERDRTTSVTLYRVAQGERGMTARYYTHDHLGSVRELVSETAVLLNRYSYEPFGRASSTSGGVASRVGFAGQDTLDYTDVSLTLYRAYDSSLGRWLSQDPLGVDVGPNTYAYVDNGPTNYGDPLGLVKVSRGITETLIKGDIDRSCGTQPAGACTVKISAAASALCQGCDDGSARAQAFLFVYGTMFIYDGPFPYKNRSPKDRSVYNSAMARAHEHRAHLDPAENAAVSVLEGLENRRFRSLDECEREKGKYTKQAIKAFYGVLKSTKNY